MKAERKQLSAAIVMTLSLAGCDQAAIPFKEPSPERMENLTHVTDKVLALARLPVSFEMSPERKAALMEAIAAIEAADEQYRGHTDALTDARYVEARACARTNTYNLSGVPRFLDHLERAQQQADKSRADAARGALAGLMGQAAECTSRASAYLMIGDHRDALKHGAIMLSQVYAVAVVTYAAYGISPEIILEAQLRDFEVIARKLGPKHETQLIADTLPKLHETLAYLEKQPAPTPQ